MDFAPVWAAHLEAREAFGSALAALWQHALTEAELAGKPWYLLDVAAMFDPDPFTLAQLEVLGPYTALERRAEHLSAAVEHGLLMPVADQGYRATIAGQRARHEVATIVHAAHSTLTPLPHVH